MGNYQERQTINNYFNLPDDDSDFMLSTIETTATCCQALRTNGYHKYGSSIPDP